MIGDVDDTGLASVIELLKSSFDIPGEEGDGGGMILPPTDIHAAAVIDATVELTGDGPTGEFRLGMLHGPFGAGREDDLVVFVGVDGGVDPEQERVGNRGSIEQFDRQFEAGSVRMQRHADQPFHPMTPFNLADPEGLAAVRMFFRVQSTGMKLDAR